MRDVTTAIGHFLLGKEESTTLRNRLLAGTGGLLGLRIAFGGLSFTLTILLARALGTGGFGVYSYAFAWIVLLGAPAILGMDQLVVREIAGYHLNSEWGLMRGLLRMANWAVFLTSLGLALLAATVSWVLRGRWAPQTLPCFWVALLLLPLIALTRVRQAALQGLHRVVLGSIPERLIQPSLLLTLVGVTYFSPRQLTAPIAMGLNVLATGVAFVIGARWLYQALPPAVKEAEPVYRNATWARSALPLLFLAGVGVLFSQASTLILGTVKGASAVGLYSVADRGAELLTFVMVAQNAAFASTAASLYATRDLERLQRLATKIARWTFLATLPLAIVFIGFGHWFLFYSYGLQFTPAQKALAILSFGQLANVSMGLNGMLLIMTGHESHAATAVGAGAAANIILNLLLVPGWGMEGAAISNASSVILWNVLATLALYRKTGIHSTVLGSLSFKRAL